MEAGATAGVGDAAEVGATEAAGGEAGAMVDTAAAGDIPVGVMEVDGVILAGVAMAAVGAMAVVGGMAAMDMVWAAWCWALLQLAQSLQAQQGKIAIITVMCSPPLTTMMKTSSLK